MHPYVWVYEFVCVKLTAMGTIADWSWPSGQSPHHQQCAQLLNENKTAKLINCKKRPPPLNVHTHSLKVISSLLFSCRYAYLQFKIMFCHFIFLKHWQAINTNSDWNTQGLISILGTYDWEHTNTHTLQVTLPPIFQPPKRRFLPLSVSHLKSTDISGITLMTPPLMAW